MKYKVGDIVKMKTQYSTSQEEMEVFEIDKIERMCLTDRVRKYWVSEDVLDLVKRTEDATNPSHYKQHKFENIEEMKIMFGLKAVYYFCICNAWKYRGRAPYKDNFELDNQKADWYLTEAKAIKEELAEV